MPLVHITFSNSDTDTMRIHLILSLLLLCMSASGQSGIRWSETTTVAPSTFGNLHPQIALDRTGDPLIIWGRASDQSVFFAKWNGQAFSEPAKLNGTLTVATASWMGPHIASYGDTMYVVMKQTPENASSSQVYIVRSEDGGATFSAPVRVDTISDSLSRFPTVTCDALGNPIVGFMKFNPMLGDSRWVVAKSTDMGRSFTTDVKASGWGGSEAVCDCCPGSITTRDNLVAMLYRNNANDIRDIWMGVSTDDGTSFSGGCNVDNNNWELPSCPATGPDGVVVGDTLYTVFSSAPEGYNRTFVSRSSIATTQHYQTSLLTEGVSGISQQNYPRIAAFGKSVGIVWKQNVLGIAQLPIWFTSDVSRGFPPTYDTVDLENISNADIALGNETVAVCWEDAATRTVGIRTGTFSLTSTNAESEDTPHALSVFPNPASDRLVIASAMNTPDAVVIVDVYGRPVLSSRVNSQRIDLDVHDLPAGMYTVRIVCSNNVITKPIVIQR